MSAAFTPGPWYYHPDGSRAGYDRIREEASDYLIATAEDGGHVDPQFTLPLETIQANATLIAAAPGLYDALEIATRTIDIIVETLAEHGFGYSENATSVAAMGRAILAKARGEQSL